MWRLSVTSFCFPGVPVLRGVCASCQPASTISVCGGAENLELVTYHEAASEPSDSSGSWRASISNSRVDAEREKKNRAVATRGAEAEGMPQDL
eukprot:5598639-Prorocentrum_lima.AAC.1